MRTHPSEVNQHLALAHGGCRRLITDAEKRNDPEGALAWRDALRAIELAEARMSEARDKQNYDRDEITPPPMRPVGCSCAVGMRAVKCRVHSCCAVYRNVCADGDGVSRQCTRQKNHTGDHRDS